MVFHPASAGIPIIDEIITGAGDAVKESQLATIITQIGEFKAANAREFVQELAKEIEEINQLIQVTANTYNAAKGVVEANNFLDAVYSGANLLGANPVIAPYKAMLDLTDACYSAMNMYLSYLDACRYFASLDRNFDFNKACSTMNYFSATLSNAFQDVDDLMRIVQEHPTDAMAVRQALAEVRARHDEICEDVLQEIERMEEEEWDIMRGEMLANAISNYPESFEIRTIGLDGGEPIKDIPQRGTAAKSGKVVGIGKDSGMDTGANLETSFYDYDEDANTTFKQAIPLVLDIASIITFVLAMLFTVRNYARKHSGEHGSDNALLKTLIGAFVIIAIIQIVRAIFVSF